MTIGLDPDNESLVIGITLRDVGQGFANTDASVSFTLQDPSRNSYTGSGLSDDPLLMSPGESYPSTETFTLPLVHGTYRLDTSFYSGAETCDPFSFAL
jgi:hypothetical protein